MSRANHRVSGGQISAAENAWRHDVTWGSGLTPEGQLVAWGTACAAASSTTDGAACEPVAWTTATTASTAPGTGSQNVVWGAACDGADCLNVVWAAAHDGNTIWSTGEGPSGVPGPLNSNVWDANAAEEPDHILWSAPAIRRQSRILVTDAAQQ